TRRSHFTLSLHRTRPRRRTQRTVGPRRVTAIACGLVDRWVDAYLDWLRVERHLSERTLIAYSSDLARFLAHAESVGAISPRELTASVVSSFLVALGRAKIS